MAWRTISLSNNGGSGTSPTTLYYQTSSYGYWATAKNTGTSYRIYSLTSRPTRSNYIFAGFFTGTNCNGTQFVSSSGSLYTGTDPGGDITIYAGWRNYATITLDRNGGSGGTASFYYKLNGGGFYSNTALTSAITSITPPTGAGVFRGYSLNGVLYIDEQGNFTPALLSATINANYTLTAQWTKFGDVTDYFGFASANLIPISSDSGDGKRRTCAANATWSGTTQNGGAGRYSSGVNDIGGIWRNPTVTYRVVGDVTFSTQLGKAYSATKSGSTMTISGWMITSVRVQTAVGKFPTITVSAVANEGANAVNNFTANANKFNVSVPVVARSKAQNLLNAINGGGHLQSCRLVAACDPVVCEENLMPCASDIVNGRYELSAETLAPNGEAAPTMTAASGTNGGFALIDDPQQGRDCDFVRYTIQARREMV